MSNPSTQSPITPNNNNNENAAENTQPSQANTESPQPSPTCPRSNQFSRTHFFLINRIDYFGFVVSLCTPVVNFYLAQKLGDLDLGITLKILMWTCFGLFWCGAFASAIVGPCISFVASIIRVLNFVPALGSSLWILLSMGLTAQVFNELERFVPFAFLNNVVFFSLIMANGLAAIWSFELDGIFTAHRSNRTFLPDKYHFLASGFTYSFVDGKCGVTSEKPLSQPHLSRYLTILCVSQDFAIAYKNIRDKSINYLRGENLDEFSLSFEIWRTEARSISRTLFWRRMLCLLGYTIETAALYFSFVFLNSIDFHPHASKDKKTIERNAIELLLPIWQIVFVVILSFFSHYLHVFMDIESTCTSAAEKSSLMLRKIESRIDWSGPKSEFLQNGRSWRLEPEGEEPEMLAAELPTIGIVANDTALEGGTTLFRSTVTNCDFTVRRLSEDIVRLQVARQEEGFETLYSESVEISETDKLM